MHELSIAQSLIELATDHATDQGVVRIKKIQIRLGVLTGMLRALYFCFDTVSKGTACEGAILEVEEVPLTVHCPRCDQTKLPGGRYNFACPTCSTPTPEIITGREMQLVCIELESSASTDLEGQAHDTALQTSALINDMKNQPNNESVPPLAESVN